MPKQKRDHKSEISQKKNKSNTSSEDDVEPTNEEFVVESILNKRKVQGQMEYEIKWKGYSHSQNTWEPKENLTHANDLLQAFEQKFKKKTHAKPKSIRIEESAESASESEEKEVEKLAKPKKKTKPEPKKSLYSRKSARLSLSDEEERIKEIENEDEDEVSEESELESIDKIEKNGKGHFILGDVAEKITHCQPTHEEIEFTISWKKRKNGTVPNSTNFMAGELRRFNKDLLLDFYESKLKFVKSKEKGK